MNPSTPDIVPHLLLAGAFISFVVFTVTFILAIAEGRRP